MTDLESLLIWSVNMYVGKHLYTTSKVWWFFYLIIPLNSLKASAQLHLTNLWYFTRAKSLFYAARGAIDARSHRRIFCRSIQCAIFSSTIKVCGNLSWFTKALESHYNHQRSLFKSKLYLWKFIVQWQNVSLYPDLSEMKTSSFLPVSCNPSYV